MWAVTERGSISNGKKKWLAAWLFRNERRLLHAVRCGIEWLLCRVGGVRWREEMPQSVRRKSRTVIRNFWPQFGLRTHGKVAVHPHPDLRRTWRWCGISSPADRVNQHDRLLANVDCRGTRYTPTNKNPSVWNFLSPKLEVTWCTVAIIIWVIFLSPYLCILGVSLSSIHHNQWYRLHINRRQ